MLENLDREAGNPNFDLSQYMHACTLDMVCGKRILINVFTELHPLSSLNKLFNMVAHIFFDQNAFIM